MKRVTYQCGHRHCRARFRLSPKRQPGLCTVCKKGTLHPTRKYIRKWNKQQGICHCGLIPYPHRPGSSHGNQTCTASTSFDPWGATPSRSPDDLIDVGF